MFDHFKDPRDYLTELFFGSRERNRPLAKKRLRRRFVIEQLESRVMLAGDVTISLSGGDLKIIGTNHDDQVAIFVESGDVVAEGFGGTTINGGNEALIIGTRRTE